MRDFHYTTPPQSINAGIGPYVLEGVPPSNTLPVTTDVVGGKYCKDTHGVMPSPIFIKFVFSSYPISPDARVGFFAVHVAAASRRSWKRAGVVLHCDILIRQDRHLYPHCQSLSVLHCSHQTPHTILYSHYHHLPLLGCRAGILRHSELDTDR